MTRAQRNNNPGNLRFAGQREAIGFDDDEFARFPNAPAGWRALVRQIELDQKRGDSIEKFIAEYAPACENDVKAYTTFITKGLNATITDELSRYSPYAIAGLIARFEGYFDVA